MTAQQLKNSILQMAVQGKLVPQIPSDEPASVLLERIRAEKEKLIKAGKIKKEKNPSVIFRGSDNLPYEKTCCKGIRCIADEIPFEIPDSWEWARCGEIFQHNTGKALNSSNRSGRLLKYITTSNLYWDRFELENLKKMFFSDTEIEKCTVCKGDLLVCEGGDFGRAAIWNFDMSIRIQNHIHRLRSYSSINTRFFYYLFYFYKNAGLIGGKGIGIQGLSSNALHALLFPVPPLAEQQRIVAKIEELLPHIEEYDRVEQKLDKLNTEFPEQLKKSILQWAIQGKLLPQNPDDEPASVLLDRIRAEKAKLVKAGKIKKDKVESVIFRRDNSHYEKLNGVERCIDDEIPFEIPASWEWVRLGALITLLSGQDFSPSEYNSHHIGIPYITGASNIENGVILINRWTDSPHNIALRGDLLIVCKGAGVGKMAILDLTKVHIARQIMAIRGYNLISNKYLMLFLTAQVNKIRAKMNGLIPGIDRNVMLNFLTPLPPLAEQKRIVAEIEKVLSLQQTMRR